LRAPKRELIPIKAHFSERSAPVFGLGSISPLDNDLTRNGRINGEPLGERIVVSGRVLDQHGQPIRNTLVEIWQANACGRYVHKIDQHDAPLDPNFVGGGRTLTDDEGRYRFLSIKPGSYPWGNHHNAWRPNHIHFSLIGPQIATRLVTQMYFPGDPLLLYDPIYKGVPEINREAMIAKFTLDLTEPNYALGYEFDIILRGVHANPFGV
jgi:protocatechuate 3,4-dioxygenase, beta subunit